MMMVTLVIYSYVPDVHMAGRFGVCTYTHRLTYSFMQVFGSVPRGFTPFLESFINTSKDFSIQRFTSDQNTKQHSK